METGDWRVLKPEIFFFLCVCVEKNLRLCKWILPRVSLSVAYSFRFKANRLEI